MGAIGPGGLTEKALNLAVATQAQAALAAAGVSALLTRTADYRMTLDARAAVVTADQPQAMVSIHHNADPDGPHAGPGSETYYQLHSAASKRLAGLIWEEVTRSLAPYGTAWQGDTDAGAKYRLTNSGADYYAVLRAHPATASVIAELAFVTDPAEAALLARPEVQKVEGQAVARGILRWLTTKDPGSGFVVPYPRTEPAGPGGGTAGCIDPAL
jgi:N-acetylmuramoyl-L-alanine amidase